MTFRRSVSDMLGRSTYRILLVLGLAAAFVAAVIYGFGLHQHLAYASTSVLIVNTTGDGEDASPGDGLCETATPGECTLRAAIMESNARTDITHTIAFSIAGEGPFTIAPGSALPEVTHPAIVDGLTQPGASCDDWPPTLLIELDGTNVPGIPGLPPIPPIGLSLAAGNSVVRGLAINRFRDNVVPFGNLGTGVAINGSGNNTIVCNFVGTEPDGDSTAPNQFGISLGNASGNVVTRNLVSGNSDNGIVIAVDPLLGGESDGNRISANLIGTDKTGRLDRGNGSDGILLVNARNTVIEDNLIAGNGDDGVDVADSTQSPAHACTTPPCATGNQVLRNRIGTDVDGAFAPALGNGDNGVELKSAENNLVAHNRIAGSGAHGVQVDDLGSCTKGSLPCAISNTIRANSVLSNAGLGIDLKGGSEDGNAVTANDAGDGDQGANNLQNYPVLDSARIAGGSLVLRGTLNSRASTTYVLDVYANPACDPAGYGEGQTWLISSTVTTGGAGNGAFVVTMTTPVDRYIVATATDPGGSSSEFSLCARANDVPVANDDTYTTNQASVLVVAAPGVLGNDSDANGLLTATLASGPFSGTLNLRSDGSFVYTPTVGFYGQDRFVYVAGNSVPSPHGPLTDTATVTIDVNPLPTVTLTVATDGDGRGAVEPGVGQHVYQVGVSVTVTATAGAGSTFAGWSGDLSGTDNPAAITMARDLTVTARFDLITFYVYLPMVLKRE